MAAGLANLCAQGSATTHGKTPDVQTYRAGLKSIAIPRPTSELAETGPDYRVLFEKYSPDTNRLIAAFVTPDTEQGIRTGTGYSLLQYALVEVPRRAEFAEATPDLFKQVVDGTASQFVTSLDSSVKESQEDLNRRLKALNHDAMAVGFDKPLYLGTLFSKQDASGFGAILTYSSKGTSIKVVMGLAVLRVQDRVVYAYLYNVYKDETTVQQLRATTEQWADAILNANRP
jgi:hypothetical protein